MILTIDIGNTNITFGGFSDDELKFVARMATDTERTTDEYASSILNILSLHSVAKKEVKGAIISSVVPPLNRVIKKAVRLIYGVEPLIVGPGIKTGISILCDNPSSVGADIICACVATHNIYGSLALIIDIGTATKIIALNENGAFIGVSIIPGVIMGLNALSEKTAQLPKIDLSAPASVIGKNTIDCMKSGVVFGNASLLDGMIDRMNEETGIEHNVYVTGGLASAIVPHCKHKMTHDKNLVLKGLNIIFKKNN